MGPVKVLDYVLVLFFVGTVLGTAEIREKRNSNNGMGSIVKFEHR